jgi:hypothetical protein
MKKFVLVLLFAALACAQPTVAPTNAPLGSARGEDVGAYNITNSFETGYRFRSVGGDLGKYRSDVNFGNGVRLLSSSLTVHSKDGHGHYFDELLLNTQGLGNDPYEYSSLRVQKNHLYRYDFTWRLNDYYNPALPIAFGQHLEDTVKTLSDHSLVLFPQSFFRIITGYSRVNQNGPALSTVNLNGTRGDEFPLFTDVRRLQNEYRLGFELTAFGAKLSVLRDWQYFRDDTRRTAGDEPGNNPADGAILNQFRRDEPYHGSTKDWRVHLLWDSSKFVTVAGRFTHSDGNRDFIFDEAAYGTDRFLGAQNRQVLVFGNGRRPVTTASLTANFFPTQRLTVVNHTAFHNARIEGDGSYSDLSNSTLNLSTVEFQFLGIRTFTNSTDLNYNFSKAAGFFAGYQYSDRQIRSIEQSAFEGTADRVAAEQSNQLHTGRVGVRLQPWKPLSVSLDAEIGRANRPIYTISEKNYHALGGRIRYKARNVQLSVLARTNYNTNSASLFAHSARSRTYSADASWTARPWLSFDASYSKLHLDTISGIAYFFDSQLIGDRSTYISNIHSGYFGARIAAGSRAEITLGYSRIQDTGDNGRTSPIFPDLTGTGTPPAGFAYQSYPLTFESPLARVSIRITNRIRWNAGYQHYRYSEQLLQTQNYRAHTGYTSLSWMF